VGAEIQSHRAPVNDRVTQKSKSKNSPAPAQTTETSQRESGRIVKTVPLEVFEIASPDYSADMTRKASLIV
jgi:hypothetical protein